MINILDSVKLQSIHPNRHVVDFSRDKVVKKEADVSLMIQGVINEPSVTTDDKIRRRLTFIARGNIVDTSNSEELFFFEFGVDYFFEISDPELFDSLSLDEKVQLCGSLSYLDFRSKLSSNMSSIGLGKIKLPLSLTDIGVSVS